MAGREQACASSTVLKSRICLPPETSLSGSQTTFHGVQERESHAPASEEPGHTSSPPDPNIPNQPTNLKTRLTIYRNVNNTTNVNNHKQTKTLASALFLFWNCKPDRNGPIQNPNTSPENKDQKRSIPINMNASDRGEVFHQFFSHTLLTLTYHSTRTTLRKLWNISS